MSRLRPAAEFALAARDPEKAQRARLRDILGRNAGTEYARTHGLDENTSPREYAARAPITTHQELAPWIDRLMKGERNLLTTEAPLYYAQTTGSTGGAKHVPITPSYRVEFQKTLHVALWHLYGRFPAAFLSRALYFVGSRQVGTAPDGNGIGTMSGFNFTELPPIVRSIYAWPYELFEVKDLRTRSYLALWLATVGNPSLIGGIFPAPIVYLLRDLAELAPELAKDMHRGQLPDWLELSPEQRATFAQWTGSRPEVAARLERASRAPDEEKVREAWPLLKLVYCWNTSTAALYVPELKRRLGPDIEVRDAIYAACEGWCSIPMGEAEPGGALSITSHYFEFIEESAFDRGDRTAIPAWAMEDGRRYYIVVTNSAGLYRYLLNDLVEMCGRYEETPRIRFVRKGGATSNLLGEKFEEDLVNRAVGAALKDTRIETTCFTLAPVVGGVRPHYALYFEPTPGTPDDALTRLRDAVDDALAKNAIEYSRLRRNGHLAPLELRRLPDGSYDRFRQERVAAGSAEAQLKIPHLVSDPASVPARAG